MSWPISAARHLRGRGPQLTVPGMETTDVHNGGLAVAVRDLRKSYGEMKAVRGVGFEVARGARAPGDGAAEVRRPERSDGRRADRNVRPLLRAAAACRRRHRARR